MNKIFPLLMLTSTSSFAAYITPFIEASVGGAGAWAAAEKGNPLGLPSKSKRLKGSFHGGLHTGGDVYVTDPSKSVAFTVGAGIGGSLATKYGAMQSGGSGSGGGGEVSGLAGTLYFSMAQVNFGDRLGKGISYLSFNSTPQTDFSIGGAGDFSKSGYTLNGESVLINGQLDSSGNLLRMSINGPANGNALNPTVSYAENMIHRVDLVPGGGGEVVGGVGGTGGGSSGGALKFHSKGYWDVSARFGVKWDRLHLVAKLGYSHHGLKAYSLSDSGSWAGLKTRGVPCLLTGLGATFDLTPSWAVGATAQVHLGKFKVKGYSSGMPFTLKEKFRAVEGLMTLTYKILPSQF